MLLNSLLRFDQLITEFLEPLDRCEAQLVIEDKKSPGLNRLCERNKNLSVGNRKTIWARILVLGNMSSYACLICPTQHYCFGIIYPAWSVHQFTSAASMCGWVGYSPGIQKCMTNPWLYYVTSLCQSTNLLLEHLLLYLSKEHAWTWSSEGQVSCCARSTTILLT